MLRSLFKLLILHFIISYFATPSFAQFPHEWTSPTMPNQTRMGWTNWVTITSGGGLVASPNRFYINDLTKIQFMHSGNYNLNVEYTYNFDQAEQNAGSYLSPIYYDLNGDDFTEFYTSKAYGTGSPYRSAIRFFDLLTNSTIIEFNEPSYSYYSNSIIDVDNDGILELLIRIEPYPPTGSYEIKVYSTGIMTQVNNNSFSAREYKLNQNFPNPFNPQTNITFSLSNSSQVKLAIYNNQGELIKTLLNKEFEAGNHSVMWDGTNIFNRKVSSGVYYYQLILDGSQQSKKMILLK